MCSEGIWDVAHIRTEVISLRIKLDETTESLIRRQCERKWRKQHINAQRYASRFSSHSLSIFLFHTLSCSSSHMLFFSLSVSLFPCLHLCPLSPLSLPPCLSSPFISFSVFLSLSLSLSCTIPSIILFLSLILAITAQNNLQYVHYGPFWVKKPLLLPFAMRMRQSRQDKTVWYMFLCM